MLASRNADVSTEIPVLPAIRPMDYHIRREWGQLRIFTGRCVKLSRI